MDAVLWRCTNQRTYLITLLIVDLLSFLLFLHFPCLVEKSTKTLTKSLSPIYLSTQGWVYNSLNRSNDKSRFTLFQFNFPSFAQYFTYYHHQSFTRATIIDIKVNCIWSYAVLTFSSNARIDTLFVRSKNNSNKDAKKIRQKIRL